MRPGAASDRELAAALEGALERRRPGSRIAALHREPCAHGSSWWVEDVRVELDDGAVFDLVFKDLGRSLEGLDAAKVKPARVRDPRREPWVYDAVLGPLHLGTPEPWAVVDGGPHGRSWLFLERVEGVPLSQVGDPAAWRAAAAWLGRFHRRAATRTLASGPLIRHDEGFHAGWLARVSTAGGSGSAAVLGAIAAGHRTAVGEALAEPPTLIHGEFYASNVLVQVSGTGRGIRPLDWEMAGLGPPLLDLAALVAGRWSDTERAGMALAYRHAALAAGAPCPPLDVFMRRLTACRLLLAVQWMGWGPRGDPPEEHRNDWLEEATRCARELAA